MTIDVKSLDIYSTVNVDPYYIFDSLTTVFQRFVNGSLTFCQRFLNSLEINVKTNSIFLKLVKFVHIVVAEYLLINQYSKEILPLGSIHFSTHQLQALA